MNFSVDSLFRYVSNQVSCTTLTLYINCSMYSAGELLVITLLLLTNIRYLRDKKFGFNLWQDLQFEPTRNVLDNIMQDLTRIGLGVTIKHAQPLSFKNELTLRQRVFKLNHPLGLLRYEQYITLSSTLLTHSRFVWCIFAIGFSLRGITKHAELIQDDIKIKYDRDGLELLEYTPYVGKTYKGGIKDRKNNNGRYVTHSHITTVHAPQRALHHV